MHGPVFTHSRCPDCSLSIPTLQLENETHECEPEQRKAHQMIQAHQIIENAEKELESFETEVEDYLRTERAQKLLAFARWREEKCSG